ncbi:SRPBCC domain-containing protein [Caballeronia sp. GAFFF2]|uniref:CoxG family protein n=1 Tax=Caballeronia sp. GAFFF2 TaxID=2921741 RepID=UPI002028935F|nr:SRPBCC domain-containing protein [Caballeronia sp. GAFFF2]
MEVTEALRVPLDPAHVKAALSDLTLLRASLDNCESFTLTPSGEYVLTLVMPIGALRARYEIRAHIARRRRLAQADESQEIDDDTSTLSFKARGEGVGSLRGQIAVAVNAEDGGADTWIEYTVWATVSGPLAALPPRQIENALHEAADDFFAEFCEVVRAKYGLPSARAEQGAVPRRHLFLRPGSMSAAFSRRGGATARAMGGTSVDGAATNVLRHRLAAHGLVRRSRDGAGAPRVFGLLAWAWLAMLVCVGLFVFFAEYVGLQ